MRQRPVRAAAAVSTLLVSFFYLLAQMAGAGGLISLLLGVKNVPGTPFDGQSLVIAVVGILMVVYVLYGGMRGTTWVQIIKATLLVIGAAVMTVWVLGPLRVQPLGPARRRRREHRQAAARRRQPVRQDGDDEDRLPVAGPRAGARHRGSAAHPDALLHGAEGQGGAPLGAVGDLDHRHLLPVHAGDRVRRRRAAAAGHADRRPTSTTRPRCWPSSSAGPCCSASSRRSRSRRSSPWSPA